MALLAGFPFLKYHYLAHRLNSEISNTFLDRKIPPLLTATTFEIISTTHLRHKVFRKPKYKKVLGDDSSKILLFLSSSASGLSRHVITHSHTCSVCLY